jgi:hypothetical protein
VRGGVYGSYLQPDTLDNFIGNVLPAACLILAAVILFIGGAWAVVNAVRKDDWKAINRFLLIFFAAAFSVIVVAVTLLFVFSMSFVD